MSEYASTWISWTAIPVGAGWAIAVGIIEDSKGKRKVRVAKGKFKATGNGEFPISQAQKFNMKPSDWPQVKAAVDEYMEVLNAKTE